MQINSYNNMQNFTGVRLSNIKRQTVEDAIKTLKRTGFDYIGRQIVYCSNDLETKIAAGKSIRNRTQFFDRRFGAVFFPWGQECYLFADSVNEQKMAKVLSQYDNGISVNFAI